MVSQGVIKVDHLIHTLYGSGAALHRVETGQYSVRNAVVQKVAFPLELNFAVATVAERYAAHQKVCGY
ncbi:hypothetical protein HYQ46_002029 [Verticillium longisporum]|nr:hypothetical protein HYQ46_002029 [Verticillium longisporum]